MNEQQLDPQGNPVLPTGQEIMKAADPEQLMETKALFPSREDWTMFQFLAKAFFDAGAIPAGLNTTAKIIVALQAGREHQMTPIQALNSFYIVNGKITMYGEAIAQQILRAGHDLTWGDCDAETATVTITRGDTKKSMSSTLTMKTAQERGYTKNSVWQKFPENMLKYRALSMIAKFIVPDALRGIQIKEDIEGTEIEEVKTSHKNGYIPVSAPVPEQGMVGEVSTRKTLAEALNEPDVPAQVALVSTKKSKKVNGTLL